MMTKWQPTVDKIKDLFSDGEPRTFRQVVKSTDLSESGAQNGLLKCWKRGILLRTAEPTYEAESTFKGRAGIKKNTRGYYLYIQRPEGEDSLRVGSNRFVAFDEKYLDKRGTKGKSKAQKIIEFLKSHSDRAYFSTEVAEQLSDDGVKQRDIMSTARRYEEKGQVYVRGYKKEDGQTPFEQGYLLTWIDSKKSRERAIEEAVNRTDRRLEKERTTSPVIQRVHRVRDLIMENSKQGELISFRYIQNELGCTEYEAEKAVTRAQELYSDLNRVKLFDVFRYYYHSSMSEEDLHAAKEMKKNYLRKTQSRRSRQGHNWEACVEWFIDNFTEGAKFKTQSHRKGSMDPRRITVHLLKPVGGRRRSAEVDRVWTVTPGPLLEPVTYVLECKWGLINKDDVDDFYEVLRWSKEFGVDTPNGRSVREDIEGVFAGNAFNPKENVEIRDEKVKLSEYAARRNIQLLKTADLNKRLHNRGCRTTLQKVCKAAAGEEEVREALDQIWDKPESAGEILSKLREKNKDLYKLEKRLEEKNE